MVSQEQLEGKWKEIKGKIQKHFGQLTDDDLDQINGNISVLLGKIAQRYGLTKEKAQEQWNEFLEDLEDQGIDLKSTMESISNMANNFVDYAKEAAKSSSKFTKEKPATALGIVALLGFIVGLFIAR